MCETNNSKEALEYDKYAMGIFKTNQDEECLVGHVPIKISSLLYHFLWEDKSNKINWKLLLKEKERLA